MFINLIFQVKCLFILVTVNYGFILVTGINFALFIILVEAL